MKIRAQLFVGITSVLVLSSSPALANNGIESIEFPFQEAAYFGDCIQEEAFLNSYVIFRTHEFATPSGVFHRLLSYEFVSTATGVSTDRTWFGESHASVNTNVAPGSTYKGLVKGVFTPVTGDGPTFLWTFYVKTTVTPDGDLVVSKDTDIDDTVKCIGRK